MGEDAAVAAVSADSAFDAAVAAVRAGADREEETRHPTIGEAADLLRRIVIRNSTQPELVRLYSMLRAESLYPGHPAYEYFKARDEQVLRAFTRLFDGLADHPGSMARQLLALMSGLEEQWLHDPGTMDLVQEWDRAMETIATSVTSPRPHRSRR